MTMRLPSPMKLRRVVGRLAIGLAVIAAVALAVMGGIIASRDFGAMERMVLARLEAESGARFRFDSRRLVAWPKPKLVFEGVRFEDEAARVAIHAPQMVLRFDLADLLDGAISGPAFTLLRPEIRVDGAGLREASASPRAMAAAIGALAGRFQRIGGLERLRLGIEDATIRLAGAKHDGGMLELRQVDLDFGVSTRRERMEISARAGGRGGFEIEASMPLLAALGNGRARPASLRVTRGAARFAFAGAMRNDADIALTGRVEASLDPRLERALFAGARTRNMPAEAPPVALRAQAHLDPRGIGLDQLRIARGDRYLSGIATLREVNGRWSLSSTLAGDLIDGSAAGAVLAGLRNPEGEWSEAPLALNPAPWLDLDIRLSTAELRLGRLRLGQAAVAVLTRGGRAEFAIVDSRHGEGTLKARVATLESDGHPELRLHVSGDRIDARAFLAETLGFDRLSGTAGFVLQAEGRGRSPAAIIRNLAGSGQVEMRGGEVSGIDLARLLQRSGESAPEQALVAALGGRTAYEQLKVNVAIRNGRVEPVGSSFFSARVAATIEGAIDLAHQQDQMIILLKRRQENPGQNGEFFAFRLDGPLFAPHFRPDLSLIGNRS